MHRPEIPWLEEAGEVFAAEEYGKPSAGPQARRDAEKAVVGQFEIDLLNVPERHRTHLASAQLANGSPQNLGRRIQEQSSHYRRHDQVRPFGRRPPHS
jgi:hypothetical protein